MNNKEDGVESYNVYNMSFMWVLLYRFILVFLSNSLASLSLVSRGNTSHASKYLSQPLCHLCPPYLPTTWYFSAIPKYITWLLPLKFYSLSLQYIAHGKIALKTIVVLNMYLCILFLISCLLSGNHVSGDAINYYTFVEYHVSCYACSSCLK